MIIMCEIKMLMVGEQKFMKIDKQNEYENNDNHVKINEYTGVGLKYRTCLVLEWQGSVRF